VLDRYASRLAVSIMKINYPAVWGMYARLSYSALCASCGEPFGMREDLRAAHSESVRERVEQLEVGIEPAGLECGEVSRGHSAERCEVAHAALALHAKLSQRLAENEQILLLLSGHRSTLRRNE
jgi:hypothetical protein